MCHFRAKKELEDFGIFSPLCVELTQLIFNHSNISWLSLINFNPLRSRVNKYWQCNWWKKINFKNRRCYGMQCCPGTLTWLCLIILHAHQTLNCQEKRTSCQLGVVSHHCNLVGFLFYYYLSGIYVSMYIFSYLYLQVGIKKLTLNPIHLGLSLFWTQAKKRPLSIQVSFRVLDKMIIDKC